MDVLFQTFQTVNMQRHRMETFKQQIERLHRREIVLEATMEKCTQKLMDSDITVETLGDKSLNHLMEEVITSEVAAGQLSEERKLEIHYLKQRNALEAVRKRINHLQEKIKGAQEIEKTYESVAKELLAHIQEVYPEKAKELETLLEHERLYEQEVFALDTLVKMGAGLVYSLNRLKCIIQGWHVELDKETLSDVMARVHWESHCFYESLKDSGQVSLKALDSLEKVSDDWMRELEDGHSEESMVTRIGESLDRWIGYILSTNESIRRIERISKEKVKAEELTVEAFLNQLT